MHASLHLPEHISHTSQLKPKLSLTFFQIYLKSKRISSPIDFAWLHITFIMWKSLQPQINFKAKSRRFTQLPTIRFKPKSQTILESIRLWSLLTSPKSFHSSNLFSSRLRSTILLCTPQIPNRYSSPQIPNRFQFPNLMVCLISHCFLFQLRLLL